MEPVTWGFIGTLIGTIAGASASIFTTLITQVNLRNIKGDEANFAREENARQFQGENLLKIQEALSVSMRLVARAHLEDLSHYANNTSGEPAMLSDELDNEILLANREVAILSERISDDDLRQNIKELRALMTTVLLAKSMEESESSLRTLSFAFDESMAKLGVVLRETI